MKHLAHMSRHISNSSKLVTPGKIVKTIHFFQRGRPKKVVASDEEADPVQQPLGAGGDVDDQADAGVKGRGVVYSYSDSKFVSFIACVRNRI